MGAPIPVRFHQFQYSFPAREEPAWKSRVERWYQLDAYAYGLAQAYTAWKPELGGPPTILLLASPHASNETDLAFVRSGASDAAAFSPAKFVHTLPNIRCSPLCQVMDWAGPVLCIQKDPHTRVQALCEAASLMLAVPPMPPLTDDERGNAPIWVLGSFRIQPALYRAELFVLGGPGPADYEVVPSPQKVALQTDTQLQEWLGSKDLSASRGLPLGRECELRKTRVGNDSDVSH